MSPEDAVDRFLRERKAEVAKSTLQNNRYALQRFTEWAEGEVLEDISELDGFHIHDFKLHRREEGVNELTLRNNLSALRVFIKWLESMGVVEGVSENIIMPSPDEVARTDRIEPDTAEQILSYLQKFEYATIRHSLFALMWDTGFRLGTVYALDVDDYHPDERYIDVVHRPDEGTPLKLKKSAERQVNLHSWVCDVLDDYIEFNRERVTDDAGRQPLSTTSNGRMAKTNLRAHINFITRPCYFSGHCPHDRVESVCDAASYYNKTQEWPSSVPPHTIRRSAITAWLNEGHPKELLSDRMNVGTDTLEKHYDARTESEKRELRRDEFGMSEE